MRCGSCRRRYEGGPGDACPHCGAAPPRARPGYMKTSTILISTERGEGHYRNLEEIPARLRSELLRTTNGANSATILIADRRGRKELARAVQGPPPAPARKRRRGLKTAGVILLLLALGLSVALLALR
jgi:hypothetical protein